MNLKKLIKPNMLKSGDNIAIVSLSSGDANDLPNKYKAGIMQLKSDFDINIIEMPNTLKSDDFLYKNPQARAKDLMDAFLNPKINAIFCTTGGDDTVRLLPYIDFDIIKNNPKIFMGYSDSTVNNFMCLKAGLSSFYGPSIMYGFGEHGGISEYIKSSVQKTLFSNEIIGKITPSKEGWTAESEGWDYIKNQEIKRNIKSSKWNFLQGNSVTQGPLIGGCIDVLEMIKGTSIWPNADYFKNAILFFEISEDAPDDPSFIKYWLRNYGSMGILQQINGMIWGRPGGNLSDEKSKEYDEVISLVLEELNLENLPVITQMDFGHTYPVFTIPFGAIGEIDMKNKKFSILSAGTK